MSRRVLATILCEDLQQEVFFSRLLKLLGYGPRDIRVVAYPAGEGCGEQHVRQRYPVEVRAFRQKAHHREGALVTIIDADRYEVSFRHRQMKESLTEGRQSDRQPDEKIAVFIPKWHIETWMHYLQGDAVTENTPLSKYPKQESECYPAVDRFIELARQSLHPADCPASLQQGFVEFARIPQ